jgi:tetratricopeptide (TPR) repeat protein
VGRSRGGVTPQARGRELAREGTRLWRELGSVGGVAAELMRRNPGVVRLQAFRYACGLSQDQAAARYNEATGHRTSVGGTTVNAWETWARRRGGSAPTFSGLLVLARAYGGGPLGVAHDRVHPSELVRDCHDRLCPEDQIALKGNVQDDPAESSVDQVRTAAGTEDQRGGSPAEPNSIEGLRRGLHDTFTKGALAEASLDDWEGVVTRYAWASRRQSPSSLLVDLTGDLAELMRSVERHRSASALPRLARVAANMSGLVCLTLCKLDDRPALRRWARTARLAAGESGDPATQSWVLAQEAYGHYYCSDFREAVDVARHAQSIAGGAACVGGVLAAALEARAHAAMDDHARTRESLSRAESILGRLGSDQLNPSAFGYTEAQLRFHEESAYTHLGDRERAFVAQDRALELCVPGDYMDWAMIRLDRARCLTDQGDVSEALTYATGTVLNLTEAQRTGIVTLRGRGLVEAMSEGRRWSAAVEEFRELVMSASDPKEV